MKLFKVLKLYFSKFLDSRFRKESIPPAARWELIPFVWCPLVMLEEDRRPSGEQSIQKCVVLPKTCGTIPLALARSLVPVQLELFLP